jgi:MFS-type transporter involved in bile tolerance (Atg22 family)
MLEINVAVLVLLFSVLVVVVDVLCTLIIAVLADYIKRWLVVGVEFERLKIVALVANLLEETAKPGSLLSGVRKSNILSFS